MDLEMSFKNKNGLFVLVFGNFCLWLTLMAVFPVMPNMAQDLCVQPSKLGMILGLASFIMIAMNIPAGVFSDRLGRKPFIICGLVLMGLSCLLAAFAHSFQFFFIAWLIGGFARGLQLSPAFAVVGDVFKPQDRGRAMGLLASSIGLGSVLGYVLGGLVGGLFSWHHLFFVLTAINLIGAAISCLLIETSKMSLERTIKSAFVHSFSWIKEPNVAILSVVTTLGFVSAVAVTFLIPFVAQKASISTTLVSVLFIPYEVVAAIGALLIGRLADKIGRKTPLIIVLTLVNIAVLSLSFCQISFVPILLIYAIVGLCEGPLIGVASTMVTDMVVQKDPRAIGSALGAFRSIYSLGAVFGPFLAGILISKMDISISFMSLFGILFLSLIICLFAKETLSFETQETRS